MKLTTHPLSWYEPGRRIIVDDSYQLDYEYKLKEYPGQNFHPEFKPDYTPLEMLIGGVFEGKYLNECVNEFPEEWFNHESLSKKPDPTINLFGVKSRLPLADWKKAGWIHPDDPRGWFQWYCRYWLGRRHEDDYRQIMRQKGFVARHRGGLIAGCRGKDPKCSDRRTVKCKCRPIQRQALFQWAANPFVNDDKTG